MIVLITEGARDERDSINGGPSSAAPVTEDESLFIDNVLDTAQKSVADRESKVLRDAMLKNCGIFPFSFQKLPDFLEQSGCEVEQKIELITTSFL